MNTRTANQASISILLSTTLFLSSCDLFGNSTLSSIAVTPETPWGAIGATARWSPLPLIATEVRKMSPLRPHGLRPTPKPPQ